MTLPLHPQDIVIRTYKGSTTLWVSQGLIIRECEIAEEHLRTVVRNRFKKSIKHHYKYGSYLPHTGAAWRWAKVNGTFYYDYACIPDRKPTHYRSKLGTKTELIEAYNDLLATRSNQKENLIKNIIKTQVHTLVDNSDTRYYMYECPVVFTQHQATQLATARAWCNYIARQLKGDRYKALGLHKKQDFLGVCADLLTPLQLEGFNISSAAYLRNKVVEFTHCHTLAAQRGFFVSGKYGNVNAQIVGKYPLVDETTGQMYDFDIHQALMFQLYMNPGGSTKEYIRQLWERYYIEDIKTFDLEPVAYRTFCHHLTRFNNQFRTAKARHGETYYKKHVLTYVTQEKLQFAHSLFAGDGSGTIAYKFRRSDGKLVKRNLYIVFMADVASRFIAGWSPSDKGSSTETSEMTRNALKIAVENSGIQTLFEFISDNHGSFTSKESKEVLNLAFNKVRTIESGNSQANPAETQFRLFKRHLKDIKNMLSTSWDSSIEGQANTDDLNIADLPTYEEAVLQMHDLIKRWNHTKLRDGVTPAERFENKHPDCKPMEPVVLRYLFGKHTKVDISYMRGYVNVHTSSGYNDTTMHQFEIPDYGGAGTELIAKATGYTHGAEVKVVWTEEMADLYTLDGKFIMSCPPSIKASQSHAERTSEQEEAYKRLNGRKTKQTSEADAFTESLSEVIEGLNYEQHMAFGGTKESYNALREDHQNGQIKKSAKQRVDRDFNDTEWQEFTN